MFRELCNQLCIRIRKEVQNVMGQVAGFLANKAGLKVVSSDSVLLPKGCRPIPLHFYDVDPAVLRQLKDGNRAILHQAMQNWRVSNQQTGKHWFAKGDQWGTKSDPKVWHRDIFPFLNPRTVKAMIADLVEASLLVVDGAWCQPLKAEFSGAEQLPLFAGKDFQQPGKVFHSSIESKGNSPKKKTSKQTTISPRKDAVADFSIPEARNQADVEMHETREAGNDGHDELYGLPAALIEGWTDAKVPLESFVARYGKEAIKQAWPNVQGFDKPIAGLRTVLAKSPSPSSALPPSSQEIALSENEAWRRRFLQSKYRDFIANTDDDTDLLSTEQDLNSGDTPIEPGLAHQWDMAYSQLKIQLDRGTVETLLQDVQLVSVDGCHWCFGVRSRYQAEMLSGRLYREIARVLSDVLGVKHDQIELRFEVEAAQHG